MGIELFMPEELLLAEMAEQASWPREPLTEFRMLTGDPRNEGDGDTGGDDGGDDSDEIDTDYEGEDEDEDGAGDEGDEGDEEEDDEAGAGTDFASMFDAFRGDVLERVDGIAARLPQQEEEQQEEEPAPDFFDPARFSDEDFDENGFLTREAQNRALNELVDQRIAEARAPEIAQQQRDRRAREANALEEKYPDLADPEKRAPVLAQAQAFAQFIAKSTGNPAASDSWREPAFLELVMLAEVGKRASAGQKPAGQKKGVTLERGGSAGPGADQGGDETKAIASRIVKTAQKQKFRLGS